MLIGPDCFYKTIFIIVLVKVALYYTFAAGGVNKKYYVVVDSANKSYMAYTLVFVF